MYGRNRCSYSETRRSLCKLVDVTIVRDNWQRHTSIMGLIRKFDEIDWIDRIELLIALASTSYFDKNRQRFVHEKERDE